jgi:hypothetical protein
LEVFQERPWRLDMLLEMYGSFAAVSNQPEESFRTALEAVLSDKLSPRLLWPGAVKAWKRGTPDQRAVAAVLEKIGALIESVRSALVKARHLCEFETFPPMEALGVYRPLPYAAEMDGLA